MTTWSHYFFRVASPKKRPGPEGGKRDLNRRQTLQRLHEAALERFLADGTAAVTIDQLVDAAGIAKGSFYRYAEDKADLVGQIMTPVGEQVIAALDRCEQALHRAKRDTLASTYLALAAELSAVVAAHAPRVLLYLQEMRAPAAPERRSIHALAEELTTRAVSLTIIARDHGLIRKVDPRVSALTVLGAIDTILFDHLRRHRADGDNAPAIRSIGELVTIVLAGIRV